MSYFVLHLGPRLLTDGTRKKSVSLAISNFYPCRAALAVTSKLYDSLDDALHRLVQVSNQRGRDLEALGRLAGLVDKLEKVCEGGRNIPCSFL